MAEHATAPQQGSAQRIAARFRERIRAGLLRAGERLPTIRSVAQEAGVTRATAQNAFRILQQEGLVESTVGRGTVVAERAAAPGSIAGPPLSRAAVAAMLALQDGAALPPLSADTDALVADLAGLQPDPALFPIEAFAACVVRVLRDSGRIGGSLGYGSTAGDAGLREVLAQRHGIGDPERVLVTSGAQQGIELVIRTFASPGDAVAVSVPTYHQLFGVLASHGVELVPIDAPDGVADLDALARVLRRPDLRLFYVMPSFHNPTGVTLDAAQRRALVDVVAATDVPILEDEFEGELRFAGSEPPSLAELDPRRLTITVRTFSKALFPGLRIGWIEAPQELVAPLRALKRFSDLESSPLLQAALRDFVVEGALDRYLTVLREALRERHDAADRALRAHMPAGCRWRRPDGGLSIWVELPPDADADRVATRAALAGVQVTPGRLFDPLRRPSRGLRLALSRVTPAAIDSGIEILGRCVREERLADPAAGLGSTPLIL
ncbi:MAG: PLP-dependent aminotransferase family protein [Planctomycetes bacterium]|nr:PLP-dependent aminotransferase family protein [Planctomycetota bacterium]